MDQTRVSTVVGGERAERSLSTPSHIDYANQLLRWVYVISLNKYVNADDITLRRTEAQFNEMYSPSQLGGGMKPSRFIRHIHSKTHKVDRLESLPECSDRVAPDEFGLQVMNVVRPSPKPPPESEIKVGPERIIDHWTWINNGNWDDTLHSLKWMAWVKNRPDKRMYHGLVYSGRSRTGKSFMAKAMEVLIGDAALCINPDDLRDKFNAWMLGLRFAYVEELQEGQDYRLYNQIKTKFTNDEILIEGKGKDKYKVRNTVNYMMFSNYAVPLSVDSDDARLFFVHSRVEKKSAEYYRELLKYMYVDGGVWAFGKYLDEEIFPLCSENFYAELPPKTRDHAALVADGMHPVEAWLVDKLAEGEGIFAPNKFFEKQDITEALSLEENLKPFLRDRSGTNGILRKHGFEGENRHTLNGRKGTFAWFNRDGWSDELNVTFALGNLEERMGLLRSVWAGSRGMRYGLVSRGK